jgi:hypothetical protein
MHMHMYKAVKLYRQYEGLNCKHIWPTLTT